eukprot:11170227-Lingulodinium_polyedra.AAC.1
MPLDVRERAAPARAGGGGRHSARGGRPVCCLIEPSAGSNPTGPARQARGCARLAVQNPMEVGLCLAAAALAVSDDHRQVVP